MAYRTIHLQNLIRGVVEERVKNDQAYTEVSHNLRPAYCVMAVHVYQCVRLNIVLIQLPNS